VQKKAAKAIERPTYLLESVDNALKLLQMLRDVGALRLKDAAKELGIAPSTAHRLFAMLLYRFRGAGRETQISPRTRGGRGSCAAGLDP
jgi:hypothetical protein